MTTTARITIKEIAADLAVSEIFVYRMLAAGEIPAVRLHTHWIVTRCVFEYWKQNCGTRRPPLASALNEVAGGIVQ